MYLSLSKTNGEPMFGPLARKYHGIDAQQFPRSGDVVFEFHTYHGFLVFFVQTEHTVICSPEAATLLLKRFFWFNLSWGMFTLAALFVPLLTIGNYLPTRRKIKQQTKALAEAKDRDEPDLLTSVDGYRYEIRWNHQTEKYHLLRFVGVGNTATHEWAEHVLADAVDLAQAQFGVPRDSWRRAGADSVPMTITKTPPMVLYVLIGLVLVFGTIALVAWLKR